MKDVEQHFGKKVDIGIANAGVAFWRNAESTTDADFDRVLSVNTKGPFCFARQLARSWLDMPAEIAESETSDGPRQAKQPRLHKQILFVSSISGIVSMFPQSQCAYNASKAGLTMLAKVRPQPAIRVHSLKSYSYRVSQANGHRMASLSMQCLQATSTLI